MLELKHDKSLLGNDILKVLGYKDEAIHKICFQGKFNIANSETIIKRIKDHLEETYKMYQYKKDNGVKFGEEELFYWSNDNKLYFDVNLNNKFTIEYNNRIVEEIEAYLKTNFSDDELYIRYQYSDIINWNKVNNYITNFQLDCNSIPFDMLSSLSYYCHVAGNRITRENHEKLLDIEIKIQEYYKNKKVVFNNIKGTVKEFKEGYYGVFKPRATRTYYPFRLSKINTLQLV